mmetsp:Transcript_18516/g.60299  ORF Transcript_18516/g.60299 Transcript_18516/m.60299 type:complete len:311 (+) Transcript_18516:3-935(+)
MMRTLPELQARLEELEAESEPEDAGQRKTLQELKKLCRKQIRDAEKARSCSVHGFRSLPPPSLQPCSWYPPSPGCPAPSSEGSHQTNNFDGNKSSKTAAFVFAGSRGVGDGERAEDAVVDGGREAVLRREGLGRRGGVAAREEASAAGVLWRGGCAGGGRGGEERLGPGGLRGVPELLHDGGGHLDRGDRLEELLLVKVLRAALEHDEALLRGGLPQLGREHLQEPERGAEERGDAVEEIEVHDARGELEREVLGEARKEPAQEVLVARDVERLEVAVERGEVQREELVEGVVVLLELRLPVRLVHLEKG